MVCNKLVVGVEIFRAVIAPEKLPPEVETITGLEKLFSVFVIPVTTAFSVSEKLRSGVDTFFPRPELAYGFLDGTIRPLPRPRTPKFEIVL